MKSRVEGWSDAKFKGFIISALRASFSRYPPKIKCIDNAYTRTKKNPETGRMCKHYRCAKCKKEFPRKKVVSDHIEPIADERGFVDFNTWVDRAFVALLDFQCLCLTCHKQKTKAEGDSRRDFKRQNKERQARKKVG